MKKCQTCLTILNSNWLNNLIANMFSKHYKNMKKILPLLFLIIISLLLRVYKLGEIPPGVTNDEIGYIYNAYSIVRTGKNIYGEQFPLITRMAVAFLPV